MAEALEQLSWPEIAALMDDGGPDAKFEIGGSIRDFGVASDWDGAPWASDTTNTVTVSSVARGSSRTWQHSATARHPGATLPAGAPPEPVAFDFEALVRRAVVQTGAPTPRRS